MSTSSTSKLQSSSKRKRNEESTTQADHDEEVCILSYKVAQKKKQKKKETHIISFSGSKEKICNIAVVSAHQPQPQLKGGEKGEKEEIFLFLGQYLLRDCINIIFEYFKRFKVAQLMNLVNHQKQWRFLLPFPLQQAQYAVPPYPDLNKWSNFRNKFPTISRQRWEDHYILNQFIFGIEIYDLFYIEKMITVLIERERQKIEKQKEDLNMSVEEYFFSSSSLLDLIIFFILISECEWQWTKGGKDDQNKEKWLSFILWILFYLFNPEVVHTKILFNGYTVCENLVCSALGNPREECIYSTFFSSTYQSNIEKMSTNKLLKILLIGGNQLVQNKISGQSMVDFVNSLSLDQFGKSRLAAIGVYEKAMSIVVNLFSFNK